MKKIKIAQVLDSVGGVEVYLRLLTENIDSDCFENIIIHKKNEEKKEYRNKLNIQIKEYNIDIDREINFIKDFKSVYQTIRILKKEKPDLIHAHSAKGGVVARLASLFYKVKVLHTPHAYSYLSAESSLKRSVFLKVEQTLKYFNSYLLATSKSEKNRGIVEVGCCEKRTFLFNNSINPFKEEKLNIDLIKAFDLPKRYLCTVGRPSYQKNIEMLVNVVFELKKDIPNIHLVVMGVGEYSPNKYIILKLIDRLNLNTNITLINWIERESVFSIIKNSLLYISAARYEGLPYSVIEGLSLSKAMVLSNCDGNKDLVVNDYNGFSCKQGDISEMVEKIKILYSNHRLRLEFEENSKKYFDRNFNLKNNINKLEEIYLRVVGMGN